MYEESYCESLTDLLMATLGSGRSVRRFRRIISDRKFNRYKKASVQVALSRLHIKGYIDNSDLGWSITKKGKKYLEDARLLSYIPSSFTKDSSANMIVSFDIPEHSRIIRNWLRSQLKIFGYKMLQQSLWIGPGPLPASFLKRLEELQIRKSVKTFKITSKKK